VRGAVDVVARARVLVLVVVREQENGLSDLAEVAGALDPVGGLAGPADDARQDRTEDQHEEDDANDDVARERARAGEEAAEHVDLPCGVAERRRDRRAYRGRGVAGIGKTVWRRGR
jgi:hypothetical protein